MTDTDDRFNQHVKQQLDAQQLDANTRLSLQHVRAKALLASSSKRWRLPWLEFAVTASLLTVLVLNLPTTKPAKAPEKAAPNTEKVAIKGNTAPTKSTAPTTTVKASAQSETDAELLENLDLYEDAEFYQWLSEQPKQGAHDA